MWTKERGLGGEETLNVVIGGMIEGHRMFSLRGEKKAPHDLMDTWRAVVFRRVWHYPVKCQWAEPGPVRRRCRKMRPRAVRASGGRMGDLRRSLASSVQALLFVLLWKRSKHQMSGWTRWPFYYSFPTKSLWNGERSRTKRKSRDEQMPGVYYYFKWNIPSPWNSNKSFIFTGGIFLFYFANIHRRHFYRITTIKTLLMSLI